MRRTFFAAVSTILGLAMLLSFKTHSTRPTGLSALGAGTAPAPAPAGTRSPAAAAASTSRVITGDTAGTPYGPVQLRITLSGGRIVRISPLQLPSDQSRSQAIASYAVPILNQEALKAQSAQIDTVSGATYTSQGYAESLQSALDKAHA